MLYITSVLVIVSSVLTSYQFKREHKNRVAIFIGLTIFFAISNLGLQYFQDRNEKRPVINPSIINGNFRGQPKQEIIIITNPNHYPIYNSEFKITISNKNISLKDIKVWSDYKIENTTSDALYLTAYCIDPKGESSIRVYYPMINSNGFKELNILTNATSSNAKINIELIDYESERENGLILTKDGPILNFKPHQSLNCDLIASVASNLIK